MFRFRLARVLKYRHRQVDLAGRDAAAAAAALQAARDDLAAAESELARLVDAAARARCGALDVRRLAEDRARHEWQLVCRARAAAAVDAAVVAHEAARQRLLAAHRQHQVLQQLEAKQREQWRADQARAERRAFDEIASIRAAASTRQDEPPHLE